MFSNFTIFSFKFLFFIYFLLTGGVYVYGLFLDGAGWDKKNMKLTEAPSKVLFTALPVIHVYAININSPKDDKKTQAPVYYKCPVYKKPNRTGKF